MKRHFEEQLDRLRVKIIKMCSLVDEQLETAIKSLLENNQELAQTVIERDKQVDKYDLKIDKICQKLFALNQPVAADLRLIMSSLNINTNLERIGDLAVNLCENFLHIKERPAFINDTRIPEMIMLTKDMVKKSFDAFINGDAKTAEDVIKSDDLLDNMNRENHAILIAIMKQSPDNIEHAVGLLVISRLLERAGDHATNIAEDVYFIYQASNIRHRYEKLIMGENGDTHDESVDASEDTED